MPTGHVFKALLYSSVFFFLLTEHFEAKPTTKIKNVSEELESLETQLLMPEKRIVGLKPNTKTRARVKPNDAVQTTRGTTRSSGRISEVKPKILGPRSLPPLKKPMKSAEGRGPANSVPDTSKLSSVTNRSNTVDAREPPDSTSATTDLPSARSRSNGAVALGPTGPTSAMTKLSSMKGRSTGIIARGLTDSVSATTDLSSLKSRSNGVATRETPDPASVTSRLSSIASCARDSVASAVNSVVSPIDEYTRKAVNGVGLVMGVVNGLASGAGTQAYNSMVRVHNTNMDNLERLKDLTRSMSHSVVDLGSSAVAETVKVLDAVRQENNRLIKKATDHVPIVRHLIALKNVADLATAQGIGTIVRGSKRMSDFAIDALAMKKAVEIEEAKGGLTGVMSGMSGLLSHKNADSLIDTFGKTHGIGEMFNGMVTENAAEDTYEMGNFIGQTVGPAKLIKITATGDVKPMFMD